MDNSTKSYIVKPVLIVRKGCLIKINPVNPLPYTLEVDTCMSCMSRSPAEVTVFIYIIMILL